VPRTTAERDGNQERVLDRIDGTAPPFGGAAAGAPVPAVFALEIERRTSASVQRFRDSVALRFLRVVRSLHSRRLPLDEQLAAQ
jgi:hypothetical protein